jgi:preprotein translocase subunit SecA
VELVRQDLLMHYVLSVPCFEEHGTRPASIADAKAEGVIAGERAFKAKIESLGEYALQLLSLVMLNVLDEKWKDHLYDLDQLRNAIHYRSWGQKDPLLEYKQEAYTMFVDLMQDVHHTFAERFLRVQLMFEEEPQVQPPVEVLAAPTRRFDAVGVAQDVLVEPVPMGTATAMDIGPSEERNESAVRRDPVVVGAGRGVRSLTPGGGAPPADWENVGRNDPCPCGSGKKFKKCHGINA